MQHPGGFRIIRHYSGQDATDAFTAFHKNKDLVKKYLNFLLIGELAPDQPCCEPTKNEMLVKDFHELRATVEKMGLFKSRFSFFAWMFMHAFILDIASWCIIWYFGKSWMPFLLGVAMFTIGQVQYDFLQHDLGHVSVFEKPKWNKVAHFLVFAILKGGPASMWNHMHNQHHAKPNCFLKDPDINSHPVIFCLGKKLSLKLGKKKRKYMPYQYQHITFVCKLSPSVSTCLYAVLSRKGELFASEMGRAVMTAGSKSQKYLLLCPLDIFLSFHSLFPTMPRHNYYKVVPLVKSLCAKHNIKYECKPLLSAFADVVRSLKESGKVWHNAYYQE
uniref:Cytochrome b5 heme-binding domain-containing protein n=1 Tax=Naja naja TaxID=35670 RepID=A0A8C6XTH8_NAJNA